MKAAKSSGITCRIAITWALISQFQCLIALSKADGIWDSKVFLLFGIETMGCFYITSMLVRIRGPTGALNLTNKEIKAY